MGTYEAKNPTSHPITLSNLMGGECLVGTPESIPESCLQQAYNFEYGGNVLQPQVVPGVALKFDVTSSADAGFYDKVHDVHIVISGTSVYKVTVDFLTKTLLGTLTGTSVPVFCMYDTYLLVASGGQIQKFDGSTLSILANSPLTHHVSVCFGRVRAYNILSDVVNYSAIGDPTNWTNNPADISSSQFIDVGYKDAGNITSSMRLSQDFIVLKSSGIPYRIIGEDDFNTVRVVAAADKVYAYNHYCGLTVQNTAYFVGQDGFNSFSTVTDYGGVKLDYPSPGHFINPWLALNSDNNAKVWHIPSKRQIWVKGQNDKIIYIYHYNVLANGVAGSWTRRTFVYQIHDVILRDNHVYVLYGNKIGELDDNIDTDDGNHFTAQITTRRSIPNLKKYIITHFNYMSYNMVSGDAILDISTKQYIYNYVSQDGDIYGDNTDIYGDNTYIVSDQFTQIRKNLQKRINYLESRITVNSGRLAIHALTVEVIEVNF
jgi:hypothetical protein